MANQAHTKRVKTNLTKDQQIIVGPFRTHLRYNTSSCEGRIFPNILKHYILLICVELARKRII